MLTKVLIDVNGVEMITTSFVMSWKASEFATVYLYLTLGSYTMLQRSWKRWHIHKCAALCAADQPDKWTALLPRSSFTEVILSSMPIKFTISFVPLSFADLWRALDIGESRLISDSPLSNYRFHPFSFQHCSTSNTG